MNLQKLLAYSKFLWAVLQNTPAFSALKQALGIYIKYKDAFVVPWKPVQIGSAVYLWKYVCLWSLLDLKS